MHFRVIAVAALMAATPALADWNTGDGHKMHYAQLPDPNGWDVHSTYYEALADDRMCSETGYVYDFHIWGSWEGGVEDSIDFIHTAFWTDDPVGDHGIPGEDPNNTWSKPLERVWHYDWEPTEFTSRLWSDTTQQGWYDPRDDTYNENDHWNMYQYNFETANITDPSVDPFWQEQGTIYWLEISMRLPFQSTAVWGWKSSIHH